MKKSVILLPFFHFPLICSFHFSFFLLCHFSFHFCHSSWHFLFFFFLLFFSFFFFVLVFMFFFFFSPSMVFTIFLAIVSFVLSCFRVPCQPLTSLLLLSPSSPSLGWAHDSENRFPMFSLVSFFAFLFFNFWLPVHLVPHLFTFFELSFGPRQSAPAPHCGR